MIGTEATRRDVLLAIGAGGALGSPARYGLSEAIPHPRGGLAVATLVTNVVGCLLIGVLMGVLTAWSLHGSEPDTLRANVLLTLAGGFTAAALPSSSGPDPLAICRQMAVSQ
jgi:CrcB protein